MSCYIGLFETCESSNNFGLSSGWFGQPWSRIKYCEQLCEVCPCWQCVPLSRWPLLARKNLRRILLAKLETSLRWVSVWDVCFRIYYCNMVECEFLVCLRMTCCLSFVYLPGQNVRSYLLVEHVQFDRDFESLSVSFRAPEDVYKTSLPWMN